MTPVPSGRCARLTASAPKFTLALASLIAVGNPVRARAATAAAIAGPAASLAAIAPGAAAPAAAAMTPAEDAAIREVLRAVSRHQIRAITDGDYAPVATLEALKAARAPKGIGWSYPWGVTLYGALRSVDVTGDQEVDRFAVDHGLAVGRYFTYLQAARERIGRTAAKGFKSPINGLINLGNLDSCGAMGVATLEGMLRHPDSVTPDEKAVVERIADWIVHRQERLPDGTFWRPTNNGGAAGMQPGTIWLDDLYMGCPFLVRWAKYTGNASFLDDAARQIINMAALLQDDDGVWYHAYFVNDHRRSPIKWGRANGWCVVATVEVLSALPENHPARAKLIAILRRHLEGISRLQAPSGLWRQALDHPEAWEETSCSAMFAYGYARAVNRGWIDPSNMAIARKAFDGLRTQVTPDGAVMGTCEGTNIGMDLAFYLGRKRPADDLHGRGVVLLAGTEILAGAR